MHPVRVISINNGWQSLQTEKFMELMDIENALDQINLATIENDWVNDTKMGLNGLSRIWDASIRRKRWVGRTESSTNKKAGTFFLKNVRNKVTARMLAHSGNTGQELAKFMLLDAPRAEDLGLCHLFVLLVPADDVLDIYAAAPENPANFTESNCRAQLDELFLLNDSAFAIIFFSPNHEDVSVENLSLRKRDAGEPSVTRSLIFPPEYYQAGVTVLSNFGEVLRDKYPDINARVRIEQEGNVVRMHIDLPNGETETVEEVLDKYFLVVSKQAPAALLFDNQLKIAKLEGKLELVDFELRQTEKLYLMAIQNNEELKNNHKTAVTDFQHLIAEQSTQIRQLIQLAAQQNASNEKVQLAQIGHSSTLFRDLVGEAHGNQVVLMALRSLEYNLMSGIATVDVQDQIQTSLATIQQSKPSLLTRIAGQVEGAGYGAAAGYVLDWVSKHVQ